MNWCCRLGNEGKIKLVITTVNSRGQLLVNDIDIEFTENDLRLNNDASDVDLQYFLYIEEVLFINCFLICY